MARRSVAETITEDLRVLVIDEPTAMTNMAAGKFGRTVTLQVTPEQVPKINIAAELGKLSLNLLPIGTVPSPAVTTDRDPNRPPVWVGDVSPALGEIKPPQNVVADPGIHVMRGNKAVQIKLR